MILLTSELREKVWFPQGPLCEESHFVLQLVVCFPSLCVSKAPVRSSNDDGERSDARQLAYLVGRAEHRGGALKSCDGNTDQEQTRSSPVQESKPW